MASKSIDWDELLLTADPKKKEIEVSFKKIDGEGNLISRGDEAGTPGGAIEGEDGSQPPVDDEGDIETPEEPGQEAPVDPVEPPQACVPHDCEAYTAFAAAEGSNILRTYASGATSAIEDAVGWNIATQGPDAGVKGRLAIGGPVITDPGGALVYNLAHLQTFDGVVDYTNHISQRADFEHQTIKAPSPPKDDTGADVGCEGAYIHPVNFGSIQANYQGRPTGRTSEFANRGEQAYWVAYGEDPSNPVTKLFSETFPLNEITLVEPWVHAEYLIHGERTAQGNGLGVVPDGGRLKFLAGNGGKWTTFNVAGNSAGSRNSEWYGEVYCTFDYANETATLEYYEMDLSSAFNTAQFKTKTISVPRERMTNCWVKSRMTVKNRLYKFDDYFYDDVYFIVFTNRVEVSIGDYVTFEVTAVDNTNRFCSSPFAEDNPGNFSKYYHPDGTGAGDNVNYCGISTRGLAFGEQSETYQGNEVDPFTLACTLGNAASDEERAAWARQWKTFQTQPYCSRIP